MIDINYTLFIQIANFLVLMWILNVIFYRPIQNMLAERAKKMSDMNSGIDGARQGVKQQADSLRKGLEKARREGMVQKEALVKAGAEEEKKIIAEINAKAQKEMEKMREQVAADVAKAEAQLSREVSVFAQAIGEKILGRAI